MTTIKQGTLAQALDMYLSSAKRQQNATNLLPAVKAAIALEAQVVQGVRSAIATIAADQDLTISQGKAPK